RHPRAQARADDRSARVCHGSAAAGDPRRRWRRTQRAALPLDSRRRRGPGDGRPGGGDAVRQPARAGDGAGRARVDLRGAGDRRRLRRADDVRAAAHVCLAGGTSPLRGGRRAADAGGERMTEVARVLHGIPAPADRWDEEATRAGVLDALVYRSNLLGSDRALANQGGGNTSAKGTVLDHAGREERVLWVKGSGTDLASITPAGFAALRLDEVVPLRERESMDDATMVD